MNQTRRVTNEILGELQAVASRIVVSGAARRGEEIDGHVTLVATSRSWGEVTPLAPSVIDLSPIRAMLYQWEEEATFRSLLPDLKDSLFGLMICQQED